MLHRTRNSVTSVQQGFQTFQRAAHALVMKSRWLLRILCTYDKRTIVQSLYNSSTMFGSSTKYGSSANSAQRAGWSSVGNQSAEWKSSEIIGNYWKLLKATISFQHEGLTPCNGVDPSRTFLFFLLWSDEQRESELT